MNYIHIWFTFKLNVEFIYLISNTICKIEQIVYNGNKVINILVCKMSFFETYCFIFKNAKNVLLASNDMLIIINNICVFNLRTWY